MSAVRKAVPSAVPSAVVQLKQTQEGVAPYKQSSEIADYPGANVNVLMHGEDVNPEGNHYWDTEGGTQSTSNLDFAPSIAGPSSMPSRVEPFLFGGSVSESDALMHQAGGMQAPYQDTLNQWTQESQRLDNNGVQSTNNTGQMTSYASPDGVTYKANNLGTQSTMQGFTMTAPRAQAITRPTVQPQAPSSLSRNSGALNDSVYGAVWQGTGNTVVNTDDVPSTAPAPAAPVYAPLGWG